MQPLFVDPTPVTPEITFSPEENIFAIKGSSSPEDVRAIYYPVIEWTKKFADEIVEGKNTMYSSENPFILKIDMDYFNSSSAKFFFDIFLEFKRLETLYIPVIIEWYYEEDDTDSMEAGNDIAILAGMEFTYIEKKRNQK
jgi:hypothetical protein